MQGQHAICGNTRAGACDFESSEDVIVCPTSSGLLSVHSIEKFQAPFLCDSSVALTLENVLYAPKIEADSLSLKVIDRADFDSVGMVVCCLELQTAGTQFI